MCWPLFGGQNPPSGCHENQLGGRIQGAIRKFSEFYGRVGVYFVIMLLTMNCLEILTGWFSTASGNIRRNGKFFAIGLCGMFVALVISGCTQTILTAPQRSATEQLLLSTAADRAIESTNLTMFAGKKVFMDTSYFDSYDGKYVLGTIRDAVSREGALFVHDMTNSDIVLEPRAGALSIDGASTLVGMPGLGVPIPLAGAVSLPELAIYKSDRQYSIAKIVLLAYETKGGKHYYSSGPLIGKAYRHYIRVMGFITSSDTDIPKEQLPSDQKKSKK